MSLAAHEQCDNPASAFARTAKQYRARPFLHIPTAAVASGQPVVSDWRYGDAADAVSTLGKSYLAAGYSRGQRIGLALDNRAAFFLHFLALNQLGISAVPLNAAMHASELGHIISHSDMVAAICLPDHRDRLLTAAEIAGCAIPITATSKVELFQPQSIAAKTDTAADDGEAALLYTSGTTGTPKGCILSNDYFMALGRNYVGLGGYCALEMGSERLATPLPVSHMNALGVSFMAMVMSGGCLIQLDRFHPSGWWQTVRDARASIIHYLGVMPAMLLNLPECSEDDFSDQIKFGFGAGVDPKHHAAFEERFGFPLIEAWSMTETGAGAWITANREPRHVGTRCFGRAPDGLDFRIVDDQSRDCPVDGPGQLLVRRAGENPRAGFFSGYYKDAEATAEAWKDGWFHTGDVVRRDRDGNFYFVDRIKNVIRRSGENIAAVEVESVILTHPAVAEVAVAPVPDELRGEEVMALVVLRKSAQLGERSGDLAGDIARHVSDRLVYYKAPGYVAFVDDLPRTASEKVQRGKVKARCRSLATHAETFDLREAKREFSRNDRRS